MSKHISLKQRWFGNYTLGGHIWQPPGSNKWWAFAQDNKLESEYPIRLKGEFKRPNDAKRAVDHFLPNYSERLKNSFYKLQRKNENPNH